MIRRYSTDYTTVQSGPYSGYSGEVSGMFSTLLVLAGIGAAATVPFLMIVWLARQ